MAIATSTGHLLVQPFALRKAVIATPPTIDTATSNRNDGNMTEKYQTEWQKKNGNGPVPEIHKIGDEQEAVPATFGNGLALQVVVHHCLVVLHQQFVQKVGNNDAGGQERHHYFCTFVSDILIRRKGENHTDDHDQHKEVSLAKETAPLEVPALLVCPEFNE